jgi:WD40 repeat protein
MLRGKLEWGGQVVILSDGYALLSGARDRTLRLWDFNPNRSTFGTQLACFDGDGEFTSMAILDGGHAVVTGDANGYVHVFDILLDIKRGGTVKRECGTC